MKQYIIESAKVAQNKRKDYTLFDHITVQVTDELPETISIKNIILRIEKTIPEHLLYDVDSIYIGNFKILKDRQIDSLFLDGSILISNNQPDEKELFGTFIHELAHAIEVAFKEKIYSDGKLANEFLSKRKTLFNMLKDDYQINKDDFYDINFRQSFDDFAYKVIGYENLGVITNGLFISPYGCTSLREYFANGFEHYFLKNGPELKQISPNLFKKIIELLKKD